MFPTVRVPIIVFTTPFTTGTVVVASAVSTYSSIPLGIATKRIAIEARMLTVAVRTTSRFARGGGFMMNP
jgi:hypothetical protein